MRIVGYIEHPVLKITVMNMNMKFVIKLETGLLEQTYKIRESDQIKNLADIEKLIDETFIQTCLERFKTMFQDMSKTVERFANKS